MPMRCGRAQWLATRFRLELFEQSTQLKGWARPTMRHQRVREVPLAVERPADDRRPCLTAVPTLPSPPSRPFKSTRAWRLEVLDSFFEVGRLGARQEDQCGDLTAKFGNLTLERL